MNNLAVMTGIGGLVDLILNIGGKNTSKPIFSINSIIEQFIISMYILEVMPECDLNIATYWASAFPVFISKKGKPVYFMQHYEEIFYNNDDKFILNKLLARLSYQLPLYKVANSSWLKRQIMEKFAQDIPFSK